MTAGALLWPWRQLVARKYGARTTLLLAFTISGLAGMILMGDVVLADVINEDELRTGQRREGSYDGMSGLIVTLSTGITAAVFGWVALRYGYDLKLDVQPDTVAQGFRLFRTVPPLIGSALAVVFLWFYPLHGERLRGVRQQLAARRGTEDVTHDGGRCEGRPEISSPEPPGLKPPPEAAGPAVPVRPDTLVR